MIEFGYDEESYPNFYSIAITRVSDGMEWQYEISDRIHQGRELYLFMCTLMNINCRMVGFNNLGYDYPVLHLIIDRKGVISPSEIYEKSKAIIESPDRFEHTVWPSDWYIPQLDLFKIHHFDNVAKSTSLKMLEYVMHSPDIQDLPFEPGTVLNDDQKDITLKYNKHDVRETIKLLHESRKEIKTREALTEKYGIDFMNANDTKIGADFFASRLEAAAPGSCFDRSSGRKVTRGTHRDVIHLREAVFPYIEFRQPEFQRICNWFKQQSITETKGVFKQLECTVNGFTFHFGAGGIHGSVESSLVQSDDEWVVIDLDVKSYYPNLAIANRVYPAHLSDVFCDVYKEVYDERDQYEKGTSENKLLKLALNGVYGKSNSHYSPFYDPLYTMTITINGQLLLCLLAEYLFTVPDLQLVQINTDGLTVRVRRQYQNHVNGIARQWEAFTGLVLDRVDYRRMFIRDVNNYIAEPLEGDVKRKGAYEYELEWHQNHSQLVVPKAAEAALLHGEDVADFIRGHQNFFDFTLRTKAPRSNYVVHGGEKVQNITRFYVSHGGASLVKIAPPPKGCHIGDYKRKNGISTMYYYDVLTELANQYGADNIPWDERIHTKNKSVHQERRTSICRGWDVTVCNNILDAVNPINHDYYIQETMKLVKPFTA